MPTKLLSADIIAAVRQSDLVGISCIVIIGIFSVIAIAIILYKLLHVHQAASQTNLFIDQAMSSANSLSQAYQEAERYPDSPMAQILKEVYLELELENWFQNYQELPLEDRVSMAKVTLEQVMERTITNETRHLESYLNFLATTGAVCPFIGLFGTVWGILGCFQGLAVQGAVSMSVLAPGISTALSTTVAGLAAAIPAVVAYNHLHTKVLNLIRRMDSFALELSNVLQKQILQRGVFVHNETPSKQL